MNFTLVHPTTLSGDSRPGGDVTGFAKRGLPHTSNLPTLTIHKIEIQQDIDLKFGQWLVPTLRNG